MLYELDELESFELVALPLDELDFSEELLLLDDFLA